MPPPDDLLILPMPKLSPEMQVGSMLIHVSHALPPKDSADRNTMRPSALSIASVGQRRTVPLSA